MKRPELYGGLATSKPITFHDLRATGITWMAIRGDDVWKITQRAGHVRIETTQGYVREAENLKAGFGEVFPRLPGSLVRVSLRVLSQDETTSRNPLFFTAKLRGGRDSNPRPPA